MSFMRASCSGDISDMPCLSWLNIESSSCFFSSSISSSKRWRAASSIQSYSWSSLTRPARSGGSCSSCWRRCCASSSRSSSRRLSPDCARLVDAPVDAFALLVDDLVELARDVLVHAAEVVAVELLAPALAQLLEHLAHAADVAALAILEALLHHPAQRGVEIAVVEEVVGHLLEQRVGVEVEPDLGAVPARVLEARRSIRRGSAPRPVGGPAPEGVLVEALGEVQALEHELDARRARRRRLADAEARRAAA